MDMLKNSIKSKKPNIQLIDKINSSPSPYNETVFDFSRTVKDLDTFIFVLLFKFL